MSKTEIVSALMKLMIEQWGRHKPIHETMVSCACGEHHECSQHITGVLAWGGRVKKFAKEGTCELSSSKGTDRKKGGGNPSRNEDSCSFSASQNHL